ncbi:MAG: hypothetical protein ACK2UW_04875 [Anaerolineales bacterium]|jgi:hypothetical protein
MKNDRIQKYTKLHYLFLVGMFLFLAFALVGCNSKQLPFEFVDGEKAVVVLVRNVDSGTYQVQYNGDQPAQIQNLQTMIAGQILHVDVQSVNLRLGDQAVTLVNNNVPEGENFVVQPGEILSIDVTYLGQSIGYNYLHGFRITYSANGESITQDATDPEQPDYQYLIDVE